MLLLLLVFAIITFYLHSTIEIDDQLSFHCITRGINTLWLSKDHVKSLQLHHGLFQLILQVQSFFVFFCCFFFICCCCFFFVFFFEKTIVYSYMNEN